jgi:rSAM/selenodomain-associated transferase 2
MGTGQSVAIVVPTLNEEQGLGAFLSGLRALRGDFTITVADGGSSDRTLEIAARVPGVRTVRAPRGRGAQMNAGARVAQGEILLFLHADTRLPPNAMAGIRGALADPRVAAGSFSLAFDHDGFWLRCFALCSRIDHLLFTYGDQGLFLRREAFESVGGFPEIPLMEDVAMLERLRRIGRLVKLPDAAITSARRFLRNGVVRQEALNVALVAAYHCGVDPARLARLYRLRRRKETTKAATDVATPATVRAPLGISST